MLNIDDDLARGLNIPAPTAPTQRQTDIKGMLGGMNLEPTAQQQNFLNQAQFAQTPENFGNLMEPEKDRLRQQQAAPFLSSQQKALRESNQIRQAYMPELNTIQAGGMAGVVEAQKIAKQLLDSAQTRVNLQGMAGTEAGSTVTAQATAEGQRQVDAARSKAEQALTAGISSFRADYRQRESADKAEQLGMTEKAQGIRDEIAERGRANLAMLAQDGVTLDDLRNSDAYEEIKQATNMSDAEIDASLTKDTGEKIVSQKQFGDEVWLTKERADGSQYISRVDTRLQEGEILKYEDGKAYAEIENEDGTFTKRPLTSEFEQAKELLQEKSRLSREESAVDFGYDSALAQQKLEQNTVNGVLNTKQNALVTKVISSFDANPEIKNFNSIQTSYGTTKNIIDNGVGGPADLAMVFGFMKGLDPTSVVRESEYQAAAESGNIFRGAWTKYNGYLKAKGGMLPPEVKQEFFNLVGQKLNAQRATYENIRNQKKKQLENQGGIQESDIYLPDYDYTSDLQGEQEQSQSQGDNLTDDEAYEAYKKSQQ